jgi:hypothetical protein
MSKQNFSIKKVLWNDRKRVLGLPISFTKYSVDEDRLYVQTGLLKTEINEVLLYRILDIKSTRSFGQKLVGVGTISLICADQSNRELELKNIKNPMELHKFLSKIIEQERQEKGIAGREIFGIGNSFNHCEHDSDADFCPTFNEFLK